MTINLHIILQKPPMNLVYALQKGSGAKYEIEQAQHSTGNDLYFDLSIEIKGDRQTHESPDFKGHFVQGLVGGRFIYLGIGTYAAQENAWGGRLKIPLTGITWTMVANKSPEFALQTIVPGTGKNGTPNCATVKPFDGWKAK
jgi:hypothetical protein